MAPFEATLLIFLQWAGYLLVFGAALHLVAHYAMRVIAHHHQCKGVTQMAIAAQAQDGGGLNEAMMAWVQAKLEAERAQNGAKR